MMREIFEGLKNLAGITKSVESLERKMDRMLDGMENMRSEVRDIDKRVVRLEELRDSIRADVKASVMQEMTRIFLGMNDKLNIIEDKCSDLKEQVERSSRKRLKKKRGQIV